MISISIKKCLRYIKISKRFFIRFTSYDNLFLLRRQFLFLKNLYFRYFTGYFLPLKVATRNVNSHNDETLPCVIRYLHLQSINAGTKNKNITFDVCVSYTLDNRKLDYAKLSLQNQYYTHHYSTHLHKKHL